MRKRRTWPRLPALGTAVLLLGATVAGCSALSLLTPDFDTSSVNTSSVKLAMPKIDGNRFMLTVDVSVGGGPATPVLVDTGSPGIRVFADKLGTTEVIRSETPVDVTFADGTRFVGVEATAPVSFGSLTTKGPINIQLITEVGCAAGQPKCAGASGIDAFKVEQPFSGLFGIGTQAGSIYSPISQLQAGSPTSFSVSANPAKGSGAITFNQTPTAPKATFDIPAWPQPRQPNGYPAWDSNAIPACWAYNKAPTECLPTSFDTGSPALITDESVPGAPKTFGVVPRGTEVTLSATAGGPKIWSMRAGSTPGRNTVEVQDLTSPNNVNSGIPIFTSNVVTFDLQNGKLLLS